MVATANRESARIDLTLSAHAQAELA